jgi:reactive intermediate/imine deaminase
VSGRAGGRTTARARPARRVAVAISAALAALGCATAPHAAAKPELLTSPAHERLGLPFSEAARVGDLIFVSGQIGNLPGTLDLAAGGVQAEARQALANVASILERNGSSLDRVAKCTVFLRDMADWPALNEVWVAALPHKPARSALGANGLAKGARVEIECIAAAGPAR